MSIQKFPTGGTSVSYTLEGIHAVWNATTTPEPGIKKKY
jgi:hypothetical protein